MRNILTGWMGYELPDSVPEHRRIMLVAGIAIRPRLIPSNPHIGW